MRGFTRYGLIVFEGRVTLKTGLKKITNNIQKVFRRLNNKERGDLIKIFKKLQELYAK